MHPPLVEIAHHRLRVREQLAVPGIARPAAAVFRVDVHQVPAHVQHTHGDWDPLVAEAVLQCEVLLLGVAVIAAPPVAQRIARQHRRLAGELIEKVQRAAVIAPEGHEIQVDMLPVGGLDPAVGGKDERGGIVDDGKAAFGQQPLAQLDRSVRFAPDLAFIGGVAVIPASDGVVERDGGAEKIAVAQQLIVPVKPGAGLAVIVVLAHLDRQSGRREGLFVIGQHQIARDDLQLVGAVVHMEVRHREASVEDDLGLGVHKAAGGTVLQPDHFVRQQRKTVMLALDDGLCLGDRGRIVAVNVGHGSSSVSR